MLAGHLQTKKGYYYAVLNCKHPDGSRFPKWIATGIPDKKGNKKAAEEALIEFRTTYNEYGEKITSGNTPPPPARRRSSKGSAKSGQKKNAAGICGDMLFADYMLAWLSYKETEVDPVTFTGYCDSVENHIYMKDYIGYVYVNEIGELINPDYISSAFPKFLRKNGLRKIRFHDTRHSCASLLLRNGVQMKEIQAWLGHSDYGTTANLYAHLDLQDSMLHSASALSGRLFGQELPSGEPSPASDVEEQADPTPKKT